MLSLTAGQQSIAHAEDASARTISGVVTLPEGVDPALIDDVRVAAYLDGAVEPAVDAVTPDADGSYEISGLEAESYRVEFAPEGEAAKVLETEVFGTTDEVVDGELIDLGDDSRADIDVVLPKAVSATEAALPDEVLPAEEVNAAPETRDEIAAEGVEAVEPSVAPVESSSAEDDKVKLAKVREAKARFQEELREYEEFKQKKDQRDADAVSEAPAEIQALMSAKAPAEKTEAVPEASYSAVTAKAPGSRTISGKITMPAGYQSWLSSVEVFVSSSDPWGSNEFAKVNATTGAWSVTVEPATYTVSFSSKTAYLDQRIMKTTYYPNTTDISKRKKIDVNGQNASNINVTMTIGMKFEGSLSVPGYAVGDGSMYLYNSQGQQVSYALSYTGRWVSNTVPAGDYWVVFESDRRTMAQMLRGPGGKTKLSGTPGTKVNMPLVGRAANSTIGGTVKAANTSSYISTQAQILVKADGKWFPLDRVAWTGSKDEYRSQLLAAGEYTVKFTSSEYDTEKTRPQWWNKKSSLATANIIKLNGSNKATGINGVVVSVVIPAAFKDVNSKHKFYREIQWMYTENISTGTRTKSGAFYKPKDGVSREAMAAFMYRIYAPANYKAPKKSPFIDVPTNHKFYKEIAWMYTSELSTGYKTPAGRAYQPKAGVSREAMAAFMYRQLHTKYSRYSVPKKSPFADIPTNHKFYKEIAWMQYSGISTGTRGGGVSLYKDKPTVSREAMAAFMYRSR